MPKIRAEPGRKALPLEDYPEQVRPEIAKLRAVEALYDRAAVLCDKAAREPPRPSLADAIARLAAARRKEAAR